MKVRDRKLKKDVSVYERDCLIKSCYWPRVNPGSFTLGKGYRSFGDSRDNEWLCGTRNAHGCPDK